MASPVLTVYINLDDMKDRRSLMEAQLNKLNLEYTRVSAVNAKSNPDITKLQLPQKDRLAFRRNLRPGELGCYLSHIKCCELLLKSNYKWALILEDDVEISKNIVNVIQNTSKIPDYIHLFQVSTLFYERKKILRSRKKIGFINNSYFINIIKPTSVGTQGYFIDRTGAEEFIKISKYIQGPVDEVLFSPNFNFSKKIKAWSLMPVLVKELPESVSSIDGRECGYGKISNLRQAIDATQRKLIKVYRKILSTRDTIKFDK